MTSAAEEMVRRSRPYYWWSREGLRSYFARRIVYAWERPAIMRKHIYTGAMGNIYGTLIGGILFVFFGTTVGISRFQWGIMGGITSWLIATQIFSALLTERTGRRKVIWFSCAIADRGLRFVGIIAAYLLWCSGSTYAGTVLISTIAIANFFGTMASPPWLSWLADIIPEHEHGAFWGRRTAWIALWSIVAVVVAGGFADWVSEDHKVVAVMGIFAAATFLGILDLVIHGTIPEPKMAMSRESHFWREVFQPVRDRNFRPWLVFNFCWTFAMTLGGALASIYFLDNLGVRSNFTGGMLAIVVTSLLGTLATGRFSGRLVDRVGTAKVLLWGHIVWAFLPAFWFVASSGWKLWWLCFSSTLGGVSVTAATTAANKLITRVPPPENRAMYIAVSTTIGSIAAGLGAFAAGAILGVLEGWSWDAGPIDLEGFHVLFAISFVLRLVFAIAFVPRISNYMGSNSQA